MGLLAPAGTPAPIIAKLHDALSRVVQQPAVKARLLDLGAEVVNSTPEQFQKLIEDEVRAFKALGQKVSLTTE